MKNIFGIIVFLSFTYLSYSVVQGSAHDFSSQGWSNGKICLPCHTPHNSYTSILSAPLWNHEVTTAVYTLYNSSSLTASPTQPQGVSKLCLSCHDGTVAIDSFGGNTGGSHVSGMSNLMTDLSDDHPISIEWQHQTNDMATSGWCLNCHNMHTVPTFVSELPFFNRNIECATCHDVHNGTSNPRLLRLPILNSEICFYCHNK